MVRRDLIQLPPESLLHPEYIRLVLVEHAGDERPAVVPVVDAITFDRETDVVGHHFEGIGLGEGAKADETEDPQ